MPESTLRRHLCALVTAGVIARHDSPNGKRYAARSRAGDLSRAFGFDLRPLLVRAAEIADAAREAEAQAERLKRLQEETSLLKRDARKLLEYGEAVKPAKGWATLAEKLGELHRRSRRKLSEGALAALKYRLKALLIRVREILGTEEMDGSNSQNERHQSSSDTEYPDREDQPETKARDQHPPPALSLELVLKACPDILPYSPHQPRRWRDLVALSGTVRTMMGIGNEVWADAQRDMGPESAAATVAAILQRISEIKSPGGYLRTLSRKAAQGRFSPAPMVLALLQPTGAPA
jgi:replication initiation protein RepC